MQTRVCTAIEGGNTEDVLRGLTAQLLRSGVEAPVLLVVFASPKISLEALTTALGAKFPKAVVVGATSAGEFTEQQSSKASASVLALSGDYQCFAGVGADQKSNPEAALVHALEGQPSMVEGYPHRTALLLLDPLSGNGEETTLLAAGLLGDTIRLAGGAAGDDLAMKETRVALGNRAISDAVVIVQLFSKRPLGVGVCHGHRPHSQPLRVTRAEGNTVFELEGRPAWDVWKEQTKEVAQSAGISVDKLPSEDEGAFLLRFEAGLASGEGEFKIRAPLSRNASGAISFACAIPEGAVLRITESSAARQVESAKAAARRALEQLGTEAAGALVFDCVCRGLILGSSFSDAVHSISSELGGVPLAGFETYGEIALDAGDLSGFHNTTTVVLAFPK